MSTLKERIAALAKRAQGNEEARSAPNYKWDSDKINAEDDSIFAELNAIDKEAGNELAIGRHLAFGVADGYANYIVTKIRKNDVVVEWIPTGDNYFSPVVGLSSDKRHWVVLRSTAEQYSKRY